MKRKGDYLLFLLHLHLHITEGRNSRINEHAQKLHKPNTLKYPPSTYKTIKNSFLTL